MPRGKKSINGKKKIASGFNLINLVYRFSDTVDLPNLSYGSLTDQQKTEKNLCIYGGLKSPFNDKIYILS